MVGVFLARRACKALLFSGHKKNMEAKKSPSPFHRARAVVFDGETGCHRLAVAELALKEGKSYTYDAELNLGGKVFATVVDSIDGVDLAVHENFVDDSGQVIGAAADADSDDAQKWEKLEGVLTNLLRQIPEFRAR